MFFCFFKTQKNFPKRNNYGLISMHIFTMIPRESLQIWRERKAASPADLSFIVVHIVFIQIRGRNVAF